VQAQASNHPKLQESRAAGVSVTEKGEARPCQVRIKETSASEPVLRCRKIANGVETGD